MSCLFENEKLSGIFEKIRGVFLSIMCLLRRIDGGHQFLQTLLSLNLGAICMGLTTGWSNASIDADIHGINKNLGLDDSFELQSAMNFGSCIGALVPILIADIHGRRFSFLCSGIVCSLCWTVVALAVNEAYIMIASTIGGIGVGIFVTTTVLYIGETSSSHNRGWVGALASFSANFGYLISGFLALFVNLKILALFMLIASSSFTITTFFCMVESPYFLFQRGKVLDAKISLKNLRGRKTILEVENEYRSIENFFNRDHKIEKKASQALLESLFPHNVKKSVIIILPVLCLSQMMGSIAINYYFEKVLRLFIQRYQYLILSSVNLISVGVCLYTIEKLGRRILLTISIVGSAICCLLLALHKLIDRHNCQSLLNGELLLPVLLILVYYAVYSFGFIPLLPILAGEIFPNRVKTIAAGICVSLVYATVLGVAKFYEILKAQMNPCLAFISFAFVGSIGLPLIITFLPEMDCESLFQIENEMDAISIVVP